MRRAALAAARILLVLALLAAAADLPLPAASAPRVRLHLIDRSASVRVPGPPASLRPEDADEIRRNDRPADGSVLWASFGRDVAFESAVVDPSGSDLALALQTVLGRNPTEIVLYSDGRADGGRSLAVCKARGVPVHVFALGPVSVKDVRFESVDAPAEIEPGARARVDVVVVSTYETRARVSLGAQSREVSLAPGAPVTAVFADVPPGRHALTLEAGDDVPANDASAVEIRERTGARRAAVHPFVPLAVPGFEVENVPPARLPAYLKDGGGLLLLGGPASFAAGGWGGGPVDALSPLRSAPPDRVAVVFGMDVSGSLAQDDRLEKVKRAAERARDLFGEGDLAPMAFAKDAEILPSWAELRRRAAGGETQLVTAIATAASHLAQREGRRHIVLLTDGVTKETPEALRAARAELGDVGLTVLTLDRELPELGTNVRIGDERRLEEEIASVLAGIRRIERKEGGRVDPQAHPAAAGVAPFAVPYLNLTSARPDAQVAATFGSAPAVYPAVALRDRVAAFAFEASAAPPKLLAQTLAQVAAPAARGPRLSIDPPFVRARGSWDRPRLRAWADGRPFELLQTASDLWEGRLPDGLGGPIPLRLESGAAATLTLPCPPELRPLGVDPVALEEIARATGGRVLRSVADLAALPPPAPSGTRGGRVAFLLAGVVLLFAELAVSTFWKPA